MNDMMRQDVEKYIYLDCACGAHAMKVTCWLDYHGNDNELYDQEWGFAMFKQEFVNKPSLWQRLKIAWKVIRTGTMHDDQLLLSTEEAEKLEGFIHRNNYAKCIER